MPPSGGYLTRIRHFKYLKKDPTMKKWRYKFELDDASVPWSYESDKRLSHVIDYGEPVLGYYLNTEQGRQKFVHIPEMCPKLVIPDLTGFRLKPYMSLSVENKSLKDISKPLTARDLYDANYSK